MLQLLVVVELHAEHVFLIKCTRGIAANRFDDLMMGEEKVKLSLFSFPPSNRIIIVQQVLQCKHGIDGFIQLAHQHSDLWGGAVNLKNC